MRILLVCLYLFLLLLTAPTHSFAAEDYGGVVSGGQVSEALTQTAHARFLPPNPLYYVIRIKEIFGRFFTASAVERAEFDFMISGKRLREAYLLLEKGDSPRMQTALSSYSKYLKKSFEQFNKAKSQNQEIVPAVDKIVSGLGYHEILLIYMAANSDSSPALDHAVDSFKGYVTDLESVKPGIKTRFKLLKTTEENKILDTPSPAPMPETPEVTGTARPSRIIY